MNKIFMISLFKTGFFYLGFSIQVICGYLASVARIKFWEFNTLKTRQTTIFSTWLLKGLNGIDVIFSSNLIFSGNGFHPLSFNLIFSGNGFHPPSLNNLFSGNGFHPPSLILYFQEMDSIHQVWIFYLQEMDSIHQVWILYFQEMDSIHQVWILYNKTSRSFRGWWLYLSSIFDVSDCLSVTIKVKAIRPKKGDKKLLSRKNCQLLFV